MKVAHLNVRLTEGGAAQVALALHRAAKEYNIDSKFYYGYSKGGGVNILKTMDSIKITSKIEAASRLMSSNLLGFEVNFFDKAANTFINEAENFDVINIHCLHSFYINYEKIFNFISDKDIPTVWTLHDHWAITGRCAFLDGCQEWINGCGRCDTLKNYPPAKIDFSAKVLKSKFKVIASTIEKLGKKFLIVSPSRHLAEDFKRIFPSANLAIIPNGISKETEFFIVNYKEKKINSHKIKILVMAHDLSYEGKTDKKLVNKIIETGNVLIETVGKNSPFHGDCVLNHGEIKDRKIIVDIIKNNNFILFSSSVDNFPLTICEALCCGRHVISTVSPAADEVLSMVGLATYNKDDIINLISKNEFGVFLGGIDQENLGNISLKKFSLNSMAEKYFNIYGSLI